MAAALLGLGGCGPGRDSGRLPDPHEIAAWGERLAAWQGAGPFSAAGTVRVESRRGEVEGEFELRVEPPGRMWAQVRSSALFGLLGERITVLLPGDGHLLTYRERDDRLERWLFERSEAAALVPGGRGEDLVALACAQIGALAWVQQPAHEQALRLLTKGEAVGFALPAPAGSPAGWLQVSFRGTDPSRIEWFVGEELRLDLRYDRFVQVGLARIPTRLQLRAPEEGLRATVRLQQVLPRKGFSAEELEVGRGRNQAPWGGVHGG